MGEPSARDFEEAVEAARALVDSADSVALLTGAGISTDSGIPDFRGKDGLWTRNPRAEEASQIDVYLEDADVRAASWRAMCDMTQRWRPAPNDGHRACVALERRGKLRRLVTQNVDGLHQQAGSDPELVTEVHGNIRETECTDCERRAAMEEATQRVLAGDPDPHCVDCGGILKPGVVLFGENLPEGAMEAAASAARQAQVLVAVGTTLSVWPVAGMVPEAKRFGTQVIIVNGGETEMDEWADVRVEGPIGKALPRIFGSDPSKL